MSSTSADIVASELQQGNTTGCVFCGSNKGRLKTVAASFAVALTGGQKWFLTKGISLHTWEQWPSLRQDQGITLNPPDRCHLHARAQSNRDAEMVIRERGWKEEQRKTGRCQFEITCKALLSAVLRSESTYGAVSCKFSSSAHGIAFQLIAF